MRNMWGTVWMGFKNVCQKVLWNSILGTLCLVFFIVRPAAYYTAITLP